jgi:hypothetical protein
MLLRKVKKKWHRFWYLLNLKLYEDCLDKREKAKIKRKIQHHKLKMFC